MARQRSEALHGLLVVDKPGLPLGERPSDDWDLPTSHDVVQRVRHWSQQRRIGHTGTLDPMASGVLVLCLGGATRLVEYYQGHDKVYDAEVTLGVATDTYDALGAVVEERPVPGLDETAVEAALSTFVGRIEQKPPIYSALKQGGESLHRKARRGEEVEVTTRPVTIHRLDLLAVSPSSLRLRIHCSVGTYVRSLAHDLGQALNTCGHLSYLRRQAAGGFSLADAHSLAAIETAAQRDALDDLLLPPGERLGLPTIVLDDESSRRLGFGQKIWLPMPDASLATGATLRGVDEAGRFLGTLVVLECSPDRTKHDAAVLVKADKWLVPLLYENEHRHL